MYAGSPKTGIAQKKKRQAIRRLSQSGKRGSALSHGVKYSVGRGRGVRVTRGQSTSVRGTRPHAITQSNPFLRDLPSSAIPQSTAGSQEEAHIQSDNPFLSGLARKKPPAYVTSEGPSRFPPPPPSYDSFTSSQGGVPSEANQPSPVSVPSFIVHGPNYDEYSDGNQMNPFLAKSAPTVSSIQVHTTQRVDDGQPKSKVTFDPSLSGMESQPNSSVPVSAVRSRVPSYSEVASVHAQPVRRKPIATGGNLPQHANLTVLHVKGIPDELNNSGFLRNHFSQFGKIKLLKCFPAKKFATVEYTNRQDAVRAKKAGKVISPDHDPVMIFWHASRPAPTSTTAALPNLQSKYTYRRNPVDNSEQPIAPPIITNDPRVQKPVPQKDDPREELPLQKSLAVKSKKPSKPSIWSRLGPEKKADDNWSPDNEAVDGGADEDEDEGVSEGRDFLKELGNKVTGDEMDTIARTADHSYFLRSMLQSDTHDGPSSSVQPLSVAQLGRGVTDSRQLYNIPKPNISLLQPPRGETASDYYDALDGRDQEIRKGMVKQTVLSEARATVGTCPDMCPEKERYRREDTRRLSWFEVRRDCGPGNPKVNHTKAIKEYSGSAADKEEPLPHDLRPLCVLQMTMDYLVSTVMDDYHERPADWYDFVWNRTRGIRKDITLQHLCTVESTELTEKCARFHILCSHLLCEEDTMTFDPRMNNENLNKCLLSLKEFYRDLRIEKDVLCPNEAEFCCYDILLHLTDGNVLNLVTQYSSSVRDSPEVSFAVDVALSLDSNNFVKFFKLVKVATFLNASILHRYFDLVRSKALKVLNRSHTNPKRPTDFPLTDLSRMLAFESTEQAAEFCELKFNLPITHQRKHVQFVRNGMSEGEQAIELRKSMYLVDSKNHKSLGEVVNGGPLPPSFSHTPFSSFSADSQRLRGSSPLPSQVTAPLPPPPSKPSYSEEDIMSVVESVTSEAVSVSVEEVAKECVQEQEKLVSEVNSVVCLSLVDDLLKDVVDKECRELTKIALMEAREVKDIKDELADTVVAGAFEEVLRYEVQEIVQSTYRDSILYAQATDAAITCLTGEIVEECVCECVRSVTSETVRQLKQERKDKLEAIRRQCLRQRTHKYWLRWFQALKVREHVRQCASDIPPLPPLLTLPWQLDMLCPVEKRRRVDVTSSAETADQLEESKREREKRRQEFFAPMDLPSFLRDSLLAFHTPSPTSHPHTPHIYWKLSFVYPSRDKLSPCDIQNINWLHRKLQFNTPRVNFAPSTQLLAVQGCEQLSISSTQVQTVDGDSSGARKRRLNIVVQGVCSCLRSGRDEVCGSSGVVLYVPTPLQENVDCELYVSQVFEMLAVVKRSFSNQQFSQGIPLLLTCSKELEDNHLVVWLSIMKALDEYCKRNNTSLSVVNCLKLNIPSHVPTSPINEEQLVCSGLQWLAEQSCPPPSLYHTPVKDFLEQGLLDLFVPLVVSDSTARGKACLPSQPPAPLINLYNYTLEHLASVATSDDLVVLDWPIPEFATQKFTHGTLPPTYWNSPSYLTQLYQCILSLQLPIPSCHQDWADLDWPQQCADCLNYISTVQLPVVESHGGNVTLMSRIKALLHHHQHMFECGETSQSECSVPWAQVILACVENFLSRLDSDLWASGFHNNKRKFSVPTSWLRAQAETSLAAAAQLTNTQSTSRKKRRRRKSDPPHLISTPFNSPARLPNTLSTPRPMAGGTKASSVGVSPVQDPVSKSTIRDDNLTKKLQSLQREKAHSQKFESQLQQWMTLPNTDENSTIEDIDLPRPTDTHLASSKEPLSLTERLEELQHQIRSAKWKEKEDNVYLHTVSKSTL